MFIIFKKSNLFLISLISIMLIVLQSIKKNYIGLSYCSEVSSVQELNQVVVMSSTKIDNLSIFFFITFVLFSILIISNSGTGIGGACSIPASQTIFSSSLGQQPISALDSVVGSANVSSLVHDTLSNKTVFVSDFLSSVDLPTIPNQPITYVDQLTNTTITVVLESIETVPYKSPDIFSKADFYAAAQSANVEDTEFLYNLLVSLYFN